MNAMIGLLVPALLGVDFGWQRKTDGSIEYIVQVDPSTFAEMQHSGIEIGSAVPPSLRPHLSALTFRVGTDRLPNADTLPVEVQTPQLNGAADSSTTASTSNYQPPGSPGGTNSWASPTTVNWPASPSSIPSSSSTTSSGSTSSQGWPAPPSTSGPVSTSGFPINPNAVPTPVPTSSSFPGSTSAPSLGTLPSSSSSGAWPVTTAPPSMSVGPRVAQPQTWNSQPREVSISARMPTDPTLAQPNLGAAPNYNYQQPAQQQPFSPQPGAFPSQFGQGQTQYAQVQYQPTANPAPTGFANPTQFQQPTGLPQQQNMPQQQGQQQPPLQQQPLQQPQQVPPGMMVTQNGQLVPIPTSNQRPPEPASASDKAVVTTRADDSKWLPFTFVLILLLTSGACNLYFGWSTYQLRERYRMLMGDRAYT